MRIGVLGSGFGQAHCDALRANGHPAEILWSRNLARAEKAARAHGVPRWTDRLEDMDGLDLVTIATPHHTHLDLIRRFPLSAIICEKPLHGRRISPEQRVRPGAPVFVHYSFPFLETARRIEAAVRDGRVGRIYRVVVNVRAWFGTPGDPLEQYLGVASHELAWLIHLFGALEYRHHAWRRDPLSAHASFGNDTVEVDLNLVQGSRYGIIMDFTFFGSAGELRCEGGWYGEQGWSFQPVLGDGVALGPAEQSTGGCIWLRSNTRFFSQAIAVLEGRLAAATARAEGVWTLADAARVEDAYGPMLQDA